MTRAEIDLLLSEIYYRAAGLRERLDSGDLGILADFDIEDRTFVCDCIGNWSFDNEFVEDFGEDLSIA